VSSDRAPGPTQAITDGDTRSGRGLSVLVLVLVAAVGLLVAAMFTALLLSAISVRNDISGGRRSADLLTASFTTERSVIDIETGLRGYLLTHDRVFLQPYQQALSAMPGNLAALRAHTVGAGEAREIAQLASAIGAYVGGYAKPLIAAGGTLTPAQQVQATNHGRALLDGLRARFNAINAEATLDRRQQRATLATGSSRSVAFAAVGLAGSVLLLIALGVYLLRRILGPTRRVAAAAGRLAQGELGVRVPEEGRGEVALLVRSFNAMAESLQARDAELVEAHRRLERAVATAEDASDMKTNFLANMSHEIRTRLNGVVGMMALLADTPLSPEQREYVQAAVTSSDALTTVVDDVLDIATIESGRMEVERCDFDLLEMIASACDMVAAAALGKGIELQSFVHEDVPRAVRGDRVRVSQILTNLIANAVKFTNAGEVVVEVSASARSEETIEVHFEVRDTGIGIAPERIPGLLEPFTQADPGTARRYGGNGLGLAISRELTQLMGGAIEADSRLGVGSSFRFTIPFAPAQTELRPPVAAAEAPAHLDPERLAELRLVFPGPELIEMLRGIDGELVAELGSLEAAIRDRERAAAGAAAHRIRNSAHVIGATALAAAAEPFELRVGESLSGDGGVSAADVERLREQWRAARAALAVELEDAAHQR